ncbi:MAG: hypothetical protein R3D70_10605 [Rhizobiaceae bacterium]
MAANSVSVPLPADWRAGDMLVGVMATEVGFATWDGTYATDGDWGHNGEGLAGNGFGSSSIRLEVKGRQATGSEAAITAALNSSPVSGRIISVRDGSFAGTMFAKAQGSGTSAAIPSVTTTADNCLLLVFAAFSTTAAFGGLANPNIGSSITQMQKLFEDPTTVDDDQTFVCWAGWQKAAGPVGTFTVTNPANGNYGAVCYSIPLLG